MRKTTLSRSLLLTAALTLGATTMTAQTVSPTPVSSPDELTDGYYVIKVTPNNNEFSGLVYYNLNDGANRHFRVDQDKQAYDNGTLETAYIWRLTKSEDGTFSLMGMHDNKFIPADASANQNFRGTETANLQITVGEGEQAGNWYVTMTNYQHSNQDTYWYNNKPDGDPNLSWWQNYTGDGAMKVEFYAISDLPETVNVTYNAKSAEYSYEFAIASYDLFVGDTYPTLDADNVPDYVTFGDFPKGTVETGTTEYTIDYTINFPFELSPAPTDGQFAEDTKWYVLNIRSTKYVRKATIGDQATTITNAAPDLNEEDYWCFTMGEGLTVNLYNLADSKPLAMTNGSNSDSQGTFGETAQDFNVVRSTEHEGKFLLNIPGSNQYINDVSNHIGVWGDVTDDGSSFVATPAIDVVNPLITTGYVGSPNEIAFTTSPTTSDLQRICTNPSILEFNPDKVYSIYNARAEESLSSESVNTDGTTMTGNVLTSEHDATSDYAALWQFETAGDNTYKLRNLNAGAYYLAGSVATLTDADAASILAIGEGNAVNNWTLSVTNNSSLGENIYLNAQHCDDANQGNPNSHEIGTWRNGANDAGNRWMLKEVNAVTVNVSDALWATLNLPFAVEIPTGVKAYTGGETSTDAVALNEVTGVIPAHTPVVLNADEAGAYTFPIAYDAVTTEPVVDNTFLGTGLRRTGFAAGSFYALANPASGVGFYTGTDAVTAVPANKAYMNRTTGSEAAGYRFIIGEDPTVGIDHAIEPATGATKTYYDLQGRRVLYPSHGIYVTQDGKKVFIK